MPKRDHGPEIPDRIDAAGIQLAREFAGIRAQHSLDYRESMLVVTALLAALTRMEIGEGSHP